MKNSIASLTPNIEQLFKALGGDEKIIAELPDAVLNLNFFSIVSYCRAFSTTWFDD